MNDKKEYLEGLRDEFKHWEALLANFSESQITARTLPSGLSLKDILAHLATWEQYTLARLEAAVHNKEPELPQWIPGVDPEGQGNLERINAWIRETNNDLAWPDVLHGWRESSRKVLELIEAIPENDFVDPTRYPWMGGKPLTLVLKGSYDHHHEEHLEPLLAWLYENGGVPEQV